MILWLLLYIMHAYLSQPLFLGAKHKVQTWQLCKFFKKNNTGCSNKPKRRERKTKSQTIFYWFHCACHSVKMTAVFLTGIQSSRSTFYPGGWKLRCTQSDRMKTSFRPLEVLRRDVVAFGCGAAFTLKRNKSQSLDAASPASIISWPLRMEMHLLVNN